MNDLGFVSFDLAAGIFLFLNIILVLLQFAVVHC